MKPKGETLYSISYFKLGVIGDSRNDVLRLDDDFGDRNPEHKDILRLDDGTRESRIVGVNAVSYDVDGFEAVLYGLTTKDVRRLLV